LFLRRDSSNRNSCCSFLCCRWHRDCWRGINVQSVSARISRGGTETASGERYNPSAWAAAIQADLRERFGGVHRGQRSGYALVEGTNKKAIIKINDVGPLKPGRIIDFDERTMRYFDPTLRLGLIHNVMVTPLQGDDWTPGPIAER
jgi:rare lipoprotein A